MKEWFCPNCKKRRETEDNIILSVCNCGYELKEVRENGEKT